ncbi:MAG TPA: 3'-5' exonuclease, partial [Thermoleophilaceae bacterium]|nr:3'-5' exonuclease [Thermoleophilaceae bacterium]
LLAKRIEEIAGEGRWKWCDVVLLLRASTHMTFYERALEERGIPTHVVGGRGYWSQQQVADLRHWLAALANPMDGLALLSLLASPLVGASLDTVALIGLEAQSSGRDPWWVLRDPGELIEKLPQADRPRLREFVKLFEGQRAAAPRASLETLIDNAVTKTGYDRHILSLPAGERRMANVRKLMRMAREYEADEGRDLRGFIDHVAERDLVQAREGEAPLEAEHVRAVRLMTVHRAKGLEFPVVCVADLGKSARDDDGGLRISEAGELGLRLASLGGHKVNTETLERLKGEQRAEAEQEEQRIYYVALTRARERLLLSGATDLVKRAEPSELCEPMRWVLRTLCPELPAEGASGEYADSYDGREVRVLWQRCTPDTVDELLSEADRQPTRPVAEAAPAPRQASLELATVPAPRALPVSRLSYSGLEAYGRCAYRFYLERALRLPESDPAPAPGTGSATGNGALPGLPARLRGTLVHELLEGLDLRTPRLPSEDEVAALAQRNGHSPRAEDIADLLAMVGAFAGAELRGRLARARRVRKELPFAFTLTPPQAHGRSLLVNGVVDVLAEEEGGALVIDYKSDRLGEADPVALCEEQYATQRLIY